MYIIGVEITILDVILIEAFSGIIRALVFFIPAGIGVQELAFVIIGGYVGLSSSISFSIALGRRIREILVGLPGIIVWYLIFSKKRVWLNQTFFCYGEPLLLFSSKFRIAD